MRYFVHFFFLFVFFCEQTLGQAQCASYDYLQSELVDQARNRSYESIRNFISNRLYNGEPRMSPAGVGGTGMSIIRIPVVVHVLYNSADQKISEQQVLSQIDILNRNFRNLNPATSQHGFKSLAADCFIEFVLATVDPDGRPTKGITWKKTGVAYFAADDKIKFNTSGGEDAWNSKHYLNIWIGKLAPGLNGYSSAPGASSEKDGIVIRYNAFGTTGAVLAPYNLGGTAVHEVGHWLGLKHIWGDRYCGDDDVSDTPSQQGPTKGCPSGVINKACDNSAAMYMNYMDVTFDACTNLFTAGQSERMRVLFADGGPRHSLLFSKGASGTALTTPAELPVDSAVMHRPVVFPNPAAHTIWVHCGGKIGERIIVSNRLGAAMMQLQVTGEMMRVDVTSLSVGLYFIRIGSHLTSKFIKVN